MLSGIVRPDGGNILIHGKQLDPESGASRKIFGYVPQDLALYEELSALDNLRFFGALYDMPPEVLEERIRKVVEIVQLGDRLKGPVRQYSGGMKRRLNIALSLLHDPELLILDEPTVGVDPQSRNLIFEALEQLIREGKTILYTTHYMEEIERLCTHVAIMDHGRVIANDSLEGVMRMLPSAESLTVKLEKVPNPGDVERLGSRVEWSAGSQTVRFEFARQGEEIVPLLEQVRALLGPITAINTERQTLEQLFLFLTGRQLRD